MNRRLFLASTAAALVMGSPALAQDPVAAIVRELKRRGYRDISTQRTLLGRAKIQARGRRGLREIIVNPATGEILRDITFRKDSGADAGDLLDDDDDGSDDDGGDDDGGDDDGGDDSGGDDNSGHGGGDKGGDSDGGGDD